MLIKTSAKTGWFHLILVVLITLGSFYIIQESFAKTLIQWDEVNEARVAEMQAMGL